MYLQFSMQVTDLLFEKVIFKRFSSSTHTYDTLSEYSMGHWKKILARLNIFRAGVRLCFQLRTKHRTCSRRKKFKNIWIHQQPVRAVLFTTMTWLSLRISKMPAKSKKRKAQLINGGIRISGEKKVQDDEKDAVIHDDEDDWHEGEGLNGYDFNADWHEGEGLNGYD
jgi:hypothetical protein